MPKLHLSNISPKVRPLSPRKHILTSSHRCWIMY